MYMHYKYMIVNIMFYMQVIFYVNSIDAYIFL